MVFVAAGQRESAPPPEPAAVSRYAAAPPRAKAAVASAALPARSPLSEALNALPAQNIFTLRLRNALDITSALELARLVRAHQIENVHAHLARDYPLAALATKRNRHAKLIITRHVLFPLNKLHAVTLSHVARVIAVSRAVERALLAQKIFPAHKTHRRLAKIEIACFSYHRLGAHHMFI